MNGLLRHRIARPRLVSLVERGPVATVVAGGGFGKSALAAECGERLGVATCLVSLEPRDADGPALVMRLRAALDRRGWSDLAGLLAGGAEPGESLDAFLNALGGEEEARLIVVDDVHHADSAGELIAGLVEGFPEHHRLLVLARRLPEHAAFAQRAGLVALDSADLAFTAAEVLELCRSVFGVELTAEEAEGLRQATGGWAAALVLAGERLARAADVGAELRAIVSQRTVLGYLLDRQLKELDTERRHVAPQLGHLPLLSAEVVDTAAGLPETFRCLLDAGLPVAELRDGWSVLPGPVREHLAGLAPLEVETARRAASVYAGRGEVMPAFETLLAAGLDSDAASLIAGLTPEAVERLDLVDLRVVVDSLAEPALKAHPRVLLFLARACEGSGQFALRSQTLLRARRILAVAGDPPLLREFDAELARDLVRDGRPDEADALAARVLAEAGAGEAAARARALDVQGRVRAWRRDPDSLAAAELVLEEAYRLCLSLGRRTWAAQVAQPLATAVLQVRGQLDRALARYEEALALLPARGHQRAVVLTFCAAVLHDLGRYEDAAAKLAEAKSLARALTHPFAAAYAAWEAARGASQVGDAQRVIAELAEAERQRGDWLEHWTGAEFLAEAADCLDRVGETAAAWQYLERALERVEEAEVGVRRAQGAVLARSGDPEQAEQVLAQVASMPRLAPAEAWRVTLLRAYAAQRRGDAEAGLLAGDAFEQAAALGYPKLPLVREPAVAGRLLAAAAAAGSRAAAALSVVALPPAIAVLGRFELTVGGRPVDVPAGRPRQLVKLLAISGGKLLAEQAIEALWPETDPDHGRRGLRNLLDRLHRAGVDLVVRDGDEIALTDDVSVDLVAFEQEARAVAEQPRSDATVALARTAVARYRGEVLPDDRYEPWAAGARERAQRRYLALLDLLIDDAERRNDLDEAIRLLGRTLESDPYDEQRYLHAARLLLTQGRRLRALTMLRRGGAVLEQLGISPPAAYGELERTIRA